MNATNDTREFFDSIWGDDEGTRFICVKPKGGEWRNTPVSTNEAAVECVEAAIERGSDCYYSVHLFQGENRKAENAIGCRAVYLDLDIKPDTYASKDDAARAVRGLMESTGLPMPTVIDSGGGLHVYWIFDGLLPEDVWAENAERLHSICKAQGLKADTAVTRDHARVLRVPGSANQKDPDHPKPCSIVNDILTYDAADIQTPLQKHAPYLPENSTEINDSFLSGIESNTDDAKELARLCLPYLSAERCDEYDDWLDVGIALSNTFEGSDEGLQIWDDWSKRSRRFKPGACEEKWSSFSERSSGDKKLTVASLVYWSQNDSVEFEAAWDTYKTGKWVERVAARSGEIQHTDYGNARRLVALYGENIRYDHRHRVWYVWNGKQWQPDSGAAVMQYAKQTAKAIYSELPKTDDDSKRQSLARWAAKSESAASLRAMVMLLESEPEIQVDLAEFDSYPHLLNVKNGVVDLRSGKILPHDPRLMLTAYIPIDYDPHAEYPIYDRFMHRIFAGNGRLIDYVQRAVGYAATGETKEQVYFICYGTGKNGKSTLLETVHYILGALAGTIRTEALMQHRFTSQGGHNDDVANLLGKRFITASETDVGQHLAESLIKQLTGGDTISASRKYGKSFQFNPSFKLFILANHKPQIQGTDEGIWRRTKFIPFGECIPENERDGDLKEKLKIEAAGILAWIVRGSIKWYAEGLGNPPEIEWATSAYRNEQDTVANFLIECCDEGKGFSVTANILYENYKQDCVDNGLDYVKQPQFADEMKKRGFEKGSVRIAGSPRKCWVGIKVKSLFDSGINSAFAVNTD